MFVNISLLQIHLISFLLKSKVVCLFKVVSVMAFKIKKKNPCAAPKQTNESTDFYNWSQ